LSSRRSSRKQKQQSKGPAPAGVTTWIKRSKRHWLVISLGAGAALIVLAGNVSDALRKLIPKRESPLRDINSQPYVVTAAFAGGLLRDGRFEPGDPTRRAPYYVNVVFENSGKAPATDVRSHIYLLYGPDAAVHLDQVFLSSVPESTGTTLAPGARSFQTAMTLDKPPMVYPARITDWNDSWPLIVCGVVAYRGLRREPYTTRFCREYMRGSHGESWRGIEGKDRVD
jgi:hypothetical protein